MLVLLSYPIDRKKINALSYDKVKASFAPISTVILNNNLAEAIEIMTDHDFAHQFSSTNM